MRSNGPREDLSLKELGIWVQQFAQQEEEYNEIENITWAVGLRKYNELVHVISPGLCSYMCMYEFFLLYYWLIGRQACDKNLTEALQYIQSAQDFSNFMSQIPQTADTCDIDNWC